MKIQYKDLFMRNLGILSWDKQRKIQNTTVAVIGCGGGSEIARQLVGSGFEKLILADNDLVESHNLNRQFYFQKDIGKNKAKALYKNLKMINPNIKAEVVTNAVTIQSVKDIVKKSDIIIDAIPPETSLKEELILAREVRKSNDKYHIYFMDIIWGAKATVFSKTSYTFEEFMGLEPNCDISEVDDLSLEDLTKNYLVGASTEMLRVGNMMYEGKLDYYPQMGLTVSLAGSMVTTLCIFLTIGKKIIFAPKVFHIDYYKLFLQN